MTPQQFLRELQHQPPAPAYLFLGQESFYRDLCARALIEKVLAPQERESGISRHDLSETPLSVVLDDACALSLFNPRRLIFVLNAEAALPKGRATDDAAAAAASLLQRYLRNPVPGVTVVFEATRYDFEGDDKPRLERVQKFFAAVPQQVEFRRTSPAEARALAVTLARKANLQIDKADIDFLVEALGGQAARVAVEIGKLELFAGNQGKVDRAMLERLVPDARSHSIFALVGALGKGDRRQSLDILDTLIRQGEYLPLALQFLSTQLRYALAAKEEKLASPAQIQSHFSALGLPMWRSRAEQIAETARTFSRAQLEQALIRIFEADVNFRSARPDDRIVMEQFIFRSPAPRSR